MSDLVKKSDQEIGNFDYEDATEGEDERLSSSLIVGDKIKFDAAQVWVDREGNPLPAGLELVALKILRAVQKWDLKGHPIEEHTRILEPHEKWPNIEELNAACPQSEWRERDGKMQGPFAGQRLVYFVDMKAPARYTWPSPKDTIGSRMCIDDLRDRIMLTRRVRGADVFPVVELTNIFMRTRHGGRQRPHLPVKRWITFGPTGEAAQAQLEPPTGVKTVAAPTAREVTNDEVPW
jgi:hypothetical protein